MSAQVLACIKWINMSFNQTIKHTKRECYIVHVSSRTFWMDSDLLWVFFFFFFLLFSLHEANILLLLELQVLQHTWHKYTILNNKHQPCFLLVWYLCTVSKKTELSIGESVSLPLPHSRNTQYYRLYPQSKQTNKATINSHSNRNQLLPFNFQKPVFSMCLSNAESCN